MPSFASQRIPAMWARAEKRGHLLEQLPQGHRDVWSELRRLESLDYKIIEMIMNKFVISAIIALITFVIPVQFLESLYGFSTLTALTLSLFFSVLCVFFFRKLYTKRIKNYVKSLPKDLDEKINQLKSTEEVITVKKVFTENGVSWNN